ncbi:MAG TPA: archaeoflavoprotein AfpA [Candidatus Bathyarchaeota archaeon]|nr:archaeoflavoprotein AfpA [Candidatus Bathyarchaeota archaeon]
MEENQKKKKRVAWGITGSGDRLVETIKVMKEINQQYQDDVRITVYLSKAGNQVLGFYGLNKDLKENFDTIRVEANANVPTLAVQLQSGKIEFLLIAPTTSNTVAKIATGIADSLLSNSTIMSLKSFVPVYILPCDYKEGVTVTQLPDGTEMKIQVRKEDVENTKKLAPMGGLFILEKPEEIHQVFQKHFKPDEA